MKNIRLKIIIRGAVQGVGFRPTVYRLAHGLGLAGWVCNSADGLIVEIEGEKAQCDFFLRELRAGSPANARVSSFEVFHLDPRGYRDFEIRESLGGDPEALILPDIAVCADCRREIFDASNRRFRYPFTNCTQCGPRYSIIQGLPYDRARTTMKSFKMCPECQKEYDDPADRRFHAQPNACPVCGPRLALRDRQGNVLAEHDQALSEAQRYIREGKVVALKGLGGFQLIVDAANPRAVERLRARKHREAKPFAVMMSSLDEVKKYCRVSDSEELLLLSAEAPIVLVEKLPDSGLAENVAPGNPYCGAMIAYTPLHILLLRDLKVPVVATSGNVSEAPMCLDETDALDRLKGIADCFLVHNRPIERAVDDSVARVVCGREMILRRARGYAPLPFVQRAPVRNGMLAVGGHLKNTVALAKGYNIFLSQHIGDLETESAYRVFQKTIADLCAVYAVDVKTVVCDEHPDYLSSRYAIGLGIECVRVQHHAAHIFSCMAENELDEPVLGVSRDGTGFGLDETVWGGEFLLVENNSVTRVASFRPFPLPGGEKAVREPRRVAAGFLFSRNQEQAFDLASQFSEQEWKNIQQMLSQRINCPMTSSAGRLFDVVAGLLGICPVMRFEAQAAMDVEFAAMKAETAECFDFNICEDRKAGGVRFFTIDVLIAEGIARDLKNGAAQEISCAKFHNTLAAVIVAVAKIAAKKKVAMSGGCFQNRYLLERAVAGLREEGFEPYWNQRVPTNDGGIALGQIVKATRTQDHKSA